LAKVIWERDALRRAVPGTTSLTWRLLWNIYVMPTTLMRTTTVF